MKSRSESKDNASLHHPDTFAIPVEKVASILETDLAQGLDQNEASERLLQYGENTLGMDGKVSIFKVFISNLINPMNAVLLAAFALAAAVQDWVCIAARKNRNLNNL